jgi:hypothetical protein
MRAKVISAIAIAALAVAACSKNYEVLVSQRQGEVFIDVRGKGPTARRSSAPCVTGFAVMELEGREVWGAQAPRGCAELTHFRYGEAPAGWRTGGAATSLVAGRRYRALVATNDGVGAALFRYGGPVP